MTYSSTILRVQETPDFCVCRFLNGSRHPDDLMAVIELLDKELAECEESSKRHRATIRDIMGTVALLYRDLLTAEQELAKRGG